MSIIVMPKVPKSATEKAPRPKTPPVRAIAQSKARKCEICGSEVAPISDEALCWVCRRLKVSAWSEGTDSQMFAAE
jgi:hypothetical protein